MPLGEIPAALSFCFTSFKHPTGSFSATTLKSRETSAGRPRPRLSSPSTTFHPSLLQTYPLSTDLVDLAFLLRLPVAMIHMPTRGWPSTARRGVLAGQPS